MLRNLFFTFSSGACWLLWLNVRVTSERTKQRWEAAVRFHETSTVSRYFACEYKIDARSAEDYKEKRDGKVALFLTGSSFSNCQQNNYFAWCAAWLSRGFLPQRSRNSFADNVNVPNTCGHIYIYICMLSEEKRNTTIVTFAISCGQMKVARHFSVSSFSLPLHEIPQEKLIN